MGTTGTTQRRGTRLVSVMYVAQGGSLTENNDRPCDDDSGPQRREHGEERRHQDEALKTCDTKLCGWEGRREREEGHTRRERRQKVGGTLMQGKADKPQAGERGHRVLHERKPEKQAALVRDCWLSPHPPPGAATNPGPAPLRLEGSPWLCKERSSREISRHE